MRSSAAVGSEEGVSVHRTVAALSVLSMLVIGACDASSSKPPDPSADPHPTHPTHTTPPRTTTPGCEVSTELVPSCGVLWGIATRPQDLATLTSVEKSVGRAFDIVYNYHDVNDVVPTATEVSEVQQGRTLHLAIASRIYGASSDAVTYAGIASGQYDTDLERQAAGVAALGVPVFMTFDQEANQHDKLGPRGTAGAFRAAWRHIHDVYVQAGATNAVWVWVMTGASENLSRAGQLWPGNDVVDWISWNVYNQSGCGSGAIASSTYTSFEAAMLPFYRWVHAQGPKLGIDADKPMMISETGSVLYAGAPGRTARWYARIPATLHKYPQIKAVTLWDSQTSQACDYTFQRSPDVLKSVARAGLDPLVHPAPR